MKECLQASPRHKLQNVFEVKLELAASYVHKLQAPKSEQAHHGAGPPHHLDLLSMTKALRTPAVRPPQRRYLGQSSSGQMTQPTRRSTSWDTLLALLKS